MAERKTARTPAGYGLFFNGSAQPVRSATGAILDALDRHFPGNPISGLRGRAGLPPSPYPPYGPPGFRPDPQRAVPYVPAEAGRLEYFPVPGRSAINPRNPSVGQGDGRFDSPRDGNRKHHGTDYTAEIGAPVVAASDGIVTRITNTPKRGYGLRVTIDHGGGLETHYGHLSQTDVRIGQKVKGGRRIGATGTTGNTPPKAQPHLHYEVRRNGRPIDSRTVTSPDYSTIANPDRRNRIIWD